MPFDEAAFTRTARELVAQGDRVPVQRAYAGTVEQRRFRDFEKGQRIHVSTPDGDPYVVVVDAVEPLEDGSGVTLTVHPAEASVLEDNIEAIKDEIARPLRREG